MGKSRKKVQKSQLQRFSLLSKMILGLTSVLILSVSVSGLLFLLMGMFPAFVAAFSDKGYGKCASKTVGAFNYMGVLPSLFEIWRSHDPSMTARMMLVSPNTWLMTYGAAAMGWVMILLMPRIVAYVFTSRSSIKTKHIEDRQKELIEEWGHAVASETA